MSLNYWTLNDINSFISAVIFGSVAFAADTTSSIVVLPLGRLAELVIIDTAKQGIDACRATIISGTVDIPTASPPILRMYRYSAGVSSVGPDIAT